MVTTRKATAAAKISTTKRKVTARTSAKANITKSKDIIPKNSPKASIAGGKYKKPEERRGILEKDKWALEVQEHKVYCRGCDKWLKLDPRVMYELSLWQKHCTRCPGIIETIPKTMGKANEHACGAEKYNLIQTRERTQAIPNKHANPRGEIILDTNGRDTSASSKGGRRPETPKFVAKTSSMNFQLQEIRTSYSLSLTGGFLPSATMGPVFGIEPRTPSQYAIESDQDSGLVPPLPLLWAVLRGLDYDVSDKSAVDKRAGAAYMNPFGRNCPGRLGATSDPRKRLDLDRRSPRRQSILTGPAIQRDLHIERIGDIEDDYFTKGVFEPDGYSSSTSRPRYRFSTQYELDRYARGSR